MIRALLPASFNMAHRFTAAWEGGVSDHPQDRGGFTAYGISEKFLRDLARSEYGRRFLDDLGLAPVNRETMRSVLSKSVAARIFRHEFWEPLGLDGLAQAAALPIYDAAVNCGPGVAVTLAQRAANKVLDAGLKVDGLLGPRTMKALEAPTLELCLAMVTGRERRCHQIVASRPSQQCFLKGWLNRCKSLKTETRALFLPDEDI